MTLASWHRGESWNPGRRRSRAEPGIPFGTKSPPDAHRSESQLPSRLNLTRSSLQSNRPTACATHSSPCLGTPPRWPQGLPPGARPDQLELQGQHEGHERRRRTQCPGDSARDPPSLGPKPGLGDTETARIVAAEQTGQAGRPGLEARGRRASWEGPRGGGRGRYSRRPPRPAARPPAAPGSGRCRGTARGSAGGSAPPGRLPGSGPRSGGAHTTAGSERELERPHPGSAPPPHRPPTARPPHPGSRRILPWAEGAVAQPPAQRLLLLRDKGRGEAGPPRQAPEVLRRRGFLLVERAWPGRLCGLCTEPRSSPKARKRAEGSAQSPCPRQPVAPTWSRARLQGAPLEYGHSGGTCSDPLSSPPRPPARSGAQNSAPRSEPPCWALGFKGRRRQRPAAGTRRAVGLGGRDGGDRGITHVAVPQRLDGRQRLGVQRAVV